jgi:hypothetical protein
VNGECCDVGRPDDASDRKLRPQLIAALLELISEQRCRQRRVDEAGGDEVDTNRGELERERGGERRQAAVAAETIPSSRLIRRPPVPPMKIKVPPGLNLPAALRATSSGSTT